MTDIVTDIQPPSVEEVLNDGNDSDIIDDEDVMYFKRIGFNPESQIILKFPCFVSFLFGKKLNLF